MMNNIDFLQLLTPDESQRNSKRYMEYLNIMLDCLVGKTIGVMKNIVVMSEIEIKNFKLEEIIKLSIIFKVVCFLIDVKA